MSRGIRWAVFGTYFYDRGLVHILGRHDDEALCGNIAMRRPAMFVHDDEPVTCFRCLAARQPKV